MKKTSVFIFCIFLLGVQGCGAKIASQEAVSSIKDMASSVQAGVSELDISNMLQRVEFEIKESGIVNLPSKDDIVDISFKDVSSAVVKAKEVKAKLTNEFSTVFGIDKVNAAKSTLTIGIPDKSHIKLNINKDLKSVDVDNIIFKSDKTEILLTSETLRMELDRHDSFTIVINKDSNGATIKYYDKEGNEISVQDSISSAS